MKIIVTMNWGEIHVREGAAVGIALDEVGKLYIATSPEDCLCLEPTDIRIIQTEVSGLEMRDYVMGLQHGPLTSCEGQN